MAAARRIVPMIALLCMGFGLSGCANGGLELDPAYWFPDGKKKLPGARQEVFPGGVPGVTQGIPPELVRGNPANQAAQQEQALAPVQQEPPPPPPAPQQAEEKPKPRPKRVARPRPPPQPEAQVQQEQQQQPVARPSQQPAPAGAWPAPQPQAQQQPAPAAGAWPAPPAAGTFTR